MTVVPLREHRLQELAYRYSDGLEVTLFWHPVTDGLTVCVCDQRRGSYFEIRPEPHQALDVFYHPYGYASFSTLRYEDERLAALERLTSAASRSSSARVTRRAPRGRGARSRARSPA
jgi:hypothetical protein